MSDLSDKQLHALFVVGNIYNQKLFDFYLENLFYGLFPDKVYNKIDFLEYTQFICCQFC